MTATAPATTRRDPLMIGIRVLLGLFGAFKLYGTLYFTFLATAAQGGDPQGVGDWLVAAWSFALATALIVAAFRLRAGDRRIAGITAGLLVVEIAFSFVKLFVYDEPEALGFMAVDLVLLALLTVAARRR
ncbi:hypothetical protein GCM10010531_30140 [Blastococcus jejuensis]|uniref:DoxX-like family protein n=1 Tax=Blastococcus jejuensis TaxID=351224 RepID=A0ABP6PCG9_9ACTN